MTLNLSFIDIETRENHDSKSSDLFFAATVPEFVIIIFLHVNALAGCKYLGLLIGPQGFGMVQCTINTVGVGCPSVSCVENLLKEVVMNTRQVCDQWFEMNRAAIDPFMRWNEIALQAAERIAGNRQVYDQWFEMNRVAIDPLMRWSEIALRAAEKVARCNLVMAQDYLEMGTRQAQLNCETRDPEKWKNEERKLISEFGQKIADHAGDYLSVAKETQDALNEWADQTARETAERATRAAESTAREAGEAARAAAKPGAQHAQKESQKG